MNEDQRERHSPLPGFERVPALDLDGAWSAVEKIGKTAEPLAKAYSRTGLEMFSLVGRRVSAYAALPGQMRDLRSPVDLVAAQLHFWEQARRDYLEAGEAVVSAWKALAPSFTPGTSAMDEPRVSRDIMAVPERDAAPVDRARSAGKEPRRAA